MDDAPRANLKDIDARSIVLSRLDVPAYYQQFFTGYHIKRSGSWSNQLPCPFHDDTGRPNFSFKWVDGNWKCQACGKGGSVFDFWLLTHGLDPKSKQDFPKAILGIANEHGIPIEGLSLSHGNLPVTHTVAKKELVRNNSFQAAHNKDANQPAIPWSVVEAMQKDLGEEAILYLVKKRGLTRATIESRKLGWHSKSFGKDRETGSHFFGRISIPIPNKSGECRNIRLHSHRCEPKYKIINYVVDKDKDTEQAYGSPCRLLGLYEFLQKRNTITHVVFTEGEFDCIKLQQELDEAGFKTWHVLSTTHGGGTFDEDYATLVEGLNVIFCYDCDEAGRHAAKNHVTKFFSDGMRNNRYHSVKIACLPLSGSKDEKDITDYFVKCNGNIDDLMLLFQSTESLEISSNSQEAQEPSTPPIEVDSLSECLKSRSLIGQHVRVRVCVTGHASKTYHAIHKFRVLCPLASVGECCCQGNEEQCVPIGDQLAIASCDSNESRILKTIATRVCPDAERNALPAIFPMEKFVMNELLVTDSITQLRAQETPDGRLTQTLDTTTATVYFMQPPNGMTVQPTHYFATGWVLTHPETCAATLYISQLDPIAGDYTLFSLSKPEWREPLNALRAFSMEDIIHQITRGVTHIYGSDEIILAILLTFTCPLYFNFFNQKVRGWMNIAILGDSGTGKSISYNRFTRWLGTGDVFSALSGKRTGFLYSVQHSGSHWSIRVGRYVHASGTAIAVDETQQMSSEDLGTMAIAMDEGLLDVSQVASGSYRTQVRCLFMMNPVTPNGQAATVSDFQFGAEALSHLFEPMFIRRLDLAVCVPMKQLDQLQALQDTDIRITPKMMQALIYFAWTRTSDQILWNEDASKEVLDQSTQLADEFGYADKVPIMSPSDVRLKVARLSVAWAILSQSFDSDPECIRVHREHVICVCNQIRILYSSESFDLSGISMHHRRKNTLYDYELIKSAFDRTIKAAAMGSSMSQKTAFQKLLLHFESEEDQVKRFDLQQMLAQPAMWLMTKVDLLKSFSLLEEKKWGLVRTRKFSMFMRQWRTEAGVTEMLANVFANSAESLVDASVAAEIVSSRKRNQDYHDPFAS